MTTKIKIGIVGSRGYTNKKKVKDLVFEIKEKYGDEVEIISGGQQDGADGYAKKFALEFNVKYVEFPPSHYSWNMHCKLPATKYNKPYYVSNYFKRNKQIAEYSDIIVAFIPDGVESRGTMNTIEYAKSLKLYSAQFTIHTPLPGTPYYQDMEKYFINPNLEDYDNNTLVFRHENFTPFQLDVLKQKAFKRFYYRPSLFLDHIKWKIKE